MAVSDFDRSHINEIMGGEGDWFTAQVLRLCQKADAPNLALLAVVFPDVVELYQQWLTSDQ